MLTKVLTGIVLSAGIIAAIIWAPFPVMAAIVALATGAAAWEFAAFAKGGRLDSAAAAASVAGAVAISAFVPDRIVAFVLLQYVMVVSILLLIMVLIRPNPIDRAGYRAAALVAAVVYLGLAGAFCVRLVTPEHGVVGRWAMLTAGVITWLNDTMAYFGGKAFGRHKMYPVISPNKTWEGSVSGMFGSIGGAFALLYIFRSVWPEQFASGHSMLSILGLAVTGGALGQVGDLVESMFKRSVPVKDSGNFLPGHGGMLDRIDAFLFVGPVTYLWLFVWFPA